ncbi:Uncharacterised protein [Bordetella pertussis]|nr:Uncharacterised protein [Bordetella pertussis]
MKTTPNSNTPSYIMQAKRRRRLGVDWRSWVAFMGRYYPASQDPGQKKPAGLERVLKGALQPPRGKLKIFAVLRSGPAQAAEWAAFEPLLPATDLMPSASLRSPAASARIGRGRNWSSMACSISWRSSSSVRRKVFGFIAVGSKASACVRATRVNPDYRVNPERMQARGAKCAMPVVIMPQFGAAGAPAMTIVGHCCGAFTTPRGARAGAYAGLR